MPLTADLVRKSFIQSTGRFTAYILFPYRITRLLAFGIVLVSLPILMVLPAVHATPQLKEGDTWTNTGTYSYSDVGWGPELGKYTEVGHVTDTYKVDNTTGTTITISETYEDAWTHSGTGWFGSTGGQTNTWTYRYIIDSTTLNVISETDQIKNASGNPTYMVVDPSKLVQGGTVMRMWWAPYAGNSTMIATATPCTVSGNENTVLNSAHLTLSNVTCSGNTIGEFSYTYGGTNQQYRYSVGPLTETYFFETTYGIMAGWSITGTFTAFEHCSGCSGGWTEDYVNNMLLTSSNINFGT
jgi:hypothetical protein